MPKDVNIHLKTTGAEQTKQQLEQTAEATKNIGDTTAEAGHKAHTAGSAFGSFFARFAGPLGIIAAVTAIANLTKRIAEFFDTIKQRSDEAVRNLQQVRAGFDDIFEALDAFDEKSRQAAVKQTYQLLQKTAVPEAVGLPIVNAYIRQFKGLVDTGQIAQEEYQKGLESMLSYGVRHGGPATADLIQIMGGWRMNQPERQAAFTRQIAAASQAVGLSDQEMIAALSRGMPTIKAMGWTPTQALETVATMAAGAAAGLQAIMAPQAEKLAYAEVAAAQQAKSAADKAKAEAARTKIGVAKKHAEQLEADAEIKELAGEPVIAAAERAKAQAIRTKTDAVHRTADQAEADADAKQLIAEQAIAAAEQLVEDPLAFLRTIEEKRSAMTRERFNRLLRDIYGREGGLAVGKLFAERRKDLAETLERAASEQGTATDREEQERFKTTLEAQDAITKARAKQIELDVTQRERIMENIREIGMQRAKVLGRREPIPAHLKRYFMGGPAGEAEYAAYREWEQSLSEEERNRIAQQTILIPGLGEFPGYSRPMTPAEQWNIMTAQEQWQALTRPPVPATPSSPPPATEGPPTSQHFDNRIINYQIFNPVSGMNKQDLGIVPPRLDA